MKVVLLYIRVIKKHDPNYTEPTSYERSAKRFLTTYRHYKPKIPHELLVVNCGSDTHDGMFDEVATRYETDFSGGFDCGTYQAVGGKQDCDLVFGLNTHTYFWMDGWLEPFVDIAKECGKGVYGVSASYEQHPHLRTPAIAFSPEVMRKYPTLVTNREQAAHFEAGPDNFSLWADREGFPSCLVTRLGSFCMEAWRNVPNGFRRGDQSNCYVWDRHTDLYKHAKQGEKYRLERKADRNAD